MKSDKADPLPDCWQCTHHYITHDPNFPYGCQAMQFKCRRLPCLEVLAASEQACLLFRQKVGSASDKSKP